MRRSVAVLTSGALLAVIAPLVTAGTAAAEQGTPGTVVAGNTFLAAVREANAGFTAGASGQAMQIVKTGGVSPGRLTVNPDGSYLLEEKKRGTLVKEMCLTPVAGHQDCYRTSKSGAWLETTDPTYDFLTGNAALVALDNVVDWYHGNVMSAAGGKTDPVYTVPQDGDALVFTESASGPDGAVTARYSYSPDRVEMSVDAGTFRLGALATRAAPITVTAPTADQMDTYVSLRSDLYALAKSLELDYVNDAVYPTRMIKASVSPGNRLRVCYNAPGEKAVAYTLLGTSNGGKTYIEYRSWDSGLVPGVVESKTGKLPSCRSLTAKPYGGKPARPMVPGPKVVNVSR